MENRARTLLTLACVFAFGFLAVYSLRVTPEDTGIKKLIPKRSVERDNREPSLPSSVTLQDSPALPLSDVGVLAAFDRELAKLTDAVVPAVVSIDTSGSVVTGVQQDYDGRLRLRMGRAEGLGSGVIVTEEGHIITNYHVIDGKESIRVTMHDGSSFEAQLIGEDAALDIAVLKIEHGEPFPSLKMGDSGAVRVGQLVFAVGNPFGLGETVTQGIISAKERSLSDTQRDLFQTDVMVNPGNSGGPLINIQGEVIGINTFIVSTNEQNPGFEGVSFAVPASDVMESFRSILERGSPVRGYLGVKLAWLSEYGRAVLNYAGNSSSAVDHVEPGSPAEQAGLRRYDIISEMNGSKVEGYEQVLNKVQRTPPGEKIQFTVWREQEFLELEATIGEADLQRSVAAELREDPLPDTETPDGMDAADEVLESVGLQVRSMSLLERARNMKGVVVTQIRARSLADSLGLKVGDEVIGINFLPVTHDADFYAQLLKARNLGEADLMLRREGRFFHIVIPQPRREEP